MHTVGLVCRRWWTGWPRESSLKSIIFGLVFIYVMCYVLAVSACVMPPPSFPDPLLKTFLLLLPKATVF